MTTAHPSAPHGPPARSSHGNQREGVVYPDPKIVTVATATAQINTPRRSQNPSSRSTTPTRRYVVILRGG
ncbi:MAG: hypothetical protein ACRDUW_00825 [Pseudonocardiaceae bacterium]